MQTTPEGLATLALLKTRFDQGRDHLELVEPFVADAIHHVQKDAFLPADIVEVVRQRCNLHLPSDTVKTVLGRFARRGKLRREGGQFLNLQMPDSHLEEARAAELTRMMRLGEALVLFATREGVELETPTALAALAQFIALNKVPLVLQEDLPDSPLERAGLDRETTRLVARFITTKCLGTEELADALQALTEGMVLQDTLLLHDVGAPPERFRGLTVILDTPVLLAALDLHGEANGLATREFLSLLREAGAITIAFDRTLDEIRRILRAYEELLGRPGGRLQLHQTELAHHVLTQKIERSDIRVISSTLERRLSRIAISIRELPNRDRRYTLDEVALAEALADKSGDTERYRIRHDVNAIASTLTLRRGRKAMVLERSRAVFCTTSGRVIRNTQAWYRAQGEHDIPPIVHQYALSSIAWFKKPRATAEVKLHELAALCSAALRPSRETWGRFIRNLEGLRNDGAISDDEAVAIVASELTEPLLARIDDSGEPDADSIRDVIDRVRSSYRAEAEADSKAAIDTAEASASKAHQEAGALSSWHVAIEERAARRGVRVGKIVSRLVFIILMTIVVLAGVISFFEIGPASTGAWRVGAKLVLGGALVLGIYSQIRGPSIVVIRNSIADRVAARVHRFLLPEEVQRPTSALSQGQVERGRSDVTGPVSDSVSNREHR